MNDLFWTACSPYLHDLQTYCKNLAGSAWEADDLVQEAMIRLYQAIQQQPDRPISRAYIRRIAKNAWIDLCRKKRITTVAYEDQEHRTNDPIFIRESFELLADCLSIRQMVLILLMDIFQFTARETAQLIHSSEGAVKEGIKRARKRLQQMIAHDQQNPDLLLSSSKRSKAKTTGSSSPAESAQTPTKELVETFLTGFRNGNPRLICEAYNNLIRSGVQVIKVNHTENRIYFTFRDPDGHVLSFFSEVSV